MSLLSGLKLGADKYPALTGVRALGATVVFLDHFPIVANAYLTINVLAFFYALSGFLIFRIYYEQLQPTKDWLLKYVVNRFARIYPVYFLMLTVAVLLSHDIRPWTLISNYTLTHALFSPAELVIQPTWSLTVEECFYFLAPLFMVLARRRGFAAVLIFGFAMLGAALVISKLPTAFLHTPGFVFSTTFFGHFLEFFAGSYLALGVIRLEAKGSLALPGRRWTIAGVVAVLLVSVAMMLVYGHVPLHLGWIIVLNNFLIPVPIALLYWGLIREKTLLSRLLSSKFAALLGKGSFSFYLLHTLVIQYVSVPWFLPILKSRVPTVLLTLVATWLASIALFICYEEPVNIWIRRRFKRRQNWMGMQPMLTE